jgi:hypothetical protein
MNATAPTARTLRLGNGLEVAFDERGDAAGARGADVLLLHGGAGAGHMPRPSSPAPPWKPPEA